MKRLVDFAGVLALLVLAGCAGEDAGMVSVKGKVTYKGKGLPSGTINFVPDTARSSYAELQPDGTYEMKAFPGTHKVFIIAQEDMSNRLPEDRSPTPASIVPNKYTAQATTDLEAVVEEGKDNTFNFDLKDEGK
jgi:hypothetical protein